MQVYFAGSIRGGRHCGWRYKELISFISSQAHVLTEHIACNSLTSFGETELTDQQIYIRDLKWLKACDVVIAEVSAPSLGVGYELACAEALGKPVLCLFGEDSSSRLSAMISGNGSFQVRRYVDLADAKLAISRFIRKWAEP